MTLLPEVRRQLNQAAEREASRRWVGGRPLPVPAHLLRRRPSVRFAHVTLVASVLVVVAIAAIFLGGRGSNPTAAPGGSVVRVEFLANPTPQSPVVSRAALERTVIILRQRLRSTFHNLTVTRSGNAGVLVVVRHPGANARARIMALSSRGQLYFYDWEASVLAPNGKTVATQLRSQRHDALVLSQGSGSAAPGSPGAGSMSLYDAVKLASQTKRAPSGPSNPRLGARYYMFGAPGSSACAQAGRIYGAAPVTGQHCLLAGPAPSIQELMAGAPPGISAGTGRVLAVPGGIAVLQAVPASFAQAPPPADPSAQFYVLIDHVAVRAPDITHPKQGTDSAGSPNVSFGFTSAGSKQFEKVTRQVAKRGALESGPVQLEQHFAIVLDTQLLTVPSIDFRQYPDGISGGGGADITGGFTPGSARNLATQLRLGPLPLQLTAVS